MKLQPVDKPEFWRERIEKAKANGYMHYSVYLANPALWAKILRIHKEIFAKEIPKDARVLDAGCGYGRLSGEFEDYTGVDFSPDFIAEAKNLYPSKRFICANLKELPFADKEFDVAFCDSVKGMIEGNLGIAEWEPIEKELRRVAKRVLILEYGDCGNPEVYDVLT